MKKLFENWRNFRNKALNEASSASQAKKEMQDRITASQAGRGFVASPTGTPWPEEDSVGNPDNPNDNSPEVEDIAKELEIRNIKDKIEAGGFNHREIGHRMSMGRPLIDYSFNEFTGVWNYTATIPNGDTTTSDKGEKLTDFLDRVGTPYQQKLGV
jgi:hypothetical protein